LLRETTTFCSHRCYLRLRRASLKQSTIINPLRRLLKRVNTFVGTIELIDLEGRQVVVSHGSDGHTHELQYDQLIIALGAGTNFFNLPGVEASSFTIKTLSDAIAIRNQVITQLEEANAECAAGARHPMLTFVVAGGGFAGVETLGGINDFVRETTSTLISAPISAGRSRHPRQCNPARAESKAGDLRATQAEHARNRDHNGHES
jgi:NADH dehydrogenase FAD-containing subunit